MAEAKDWVKAGFLLRRSDSIFQSWNRRYIGVKARQMACFRTDKDAAPKHTFSLERAKVKKESPMKKKNFCFTVINKDESWVLAAEDEETRDSWIQTIKQCIPSQSLKRSVSFNEGIHVDKKDSIEDPPKETSTGNGLNTPKAESDSRLGKKEEKKDSGEKKESGEKNEAKKKDEDKKNERREERKEEDRRPEPMKITVTNIQELQQDKDGKILVERTGLPLELLQQHFDLYLSILNFIQRTKKFVNPNVKDRHRSSRPRLDEETIARLEEEIISPMPEAKRLFKHPEQVGEGGFGLVLRMDVSGDKGKPKLPSTVAVKKMKHSTLKERSNNMREIGFLRRLDHLNIVKYYRTYRAFPIKDKQPVTDEIWMIMEFLEGGTLAQARSDHKFQEDNIAYIARELLTGVAYLHSLNLAHRDLKSANVMLSVEGGVKMIDFGLCAEMTQPRDDVCGSPFWLPPEMIKNETHTQAVDIWSFAICLMELANGAPPHEHCAAKAMFIAATEGYPQPFDQPDRWSAEMKNFFSKCLVVDPSKRASAKELLRHPWLEKASTKKTMKNILTDIFIRDTLRDVGFG